MNISEKIKEIEFVSTLEIWCPLLPFDFYYENVLNYNKTIFNEKCFIISISYCLKNNYDYKLIKYFYDKTKNIKNFINYNNEYKYLTYNEKTLLDKFFEDLEIIEFKNFLKKELQIKDNNIKGKNKI